LKSHKSALTSTITNSIINKARTIVQTKTVFRVSILSLLLGTLVACGGGGGGSTASTGGTAGATNNSFALPSSINTTGQ
jgi:hypothetical protein